MAERFAKLYSLPNNLFAEGSPIIISAGALLKDAQSGNIIAQVKFHSISEKLIRAVKISLSSFDVAGKALGDIEDYQYLDLDVGNGQEFGSNKAIIMPSAVTRSFSITSLVVVFGDGTTWESGVPLAALSEPKPLMHVFGNGELQKQYRLETNDIAKYCPKEEQGIWQCACGFWNSGYICAQCRSNKETIFAAFDAAALTDRMNIRLAAETEQKRSIAEKKNRRIKRNKIIAIFTTALIVIVAAIVLALNFIILPAINYGDAVALMNEGKYKDAIIAFELLDGYKDSESKIEECNTKIIEKRYNNALTLMSNAEYEDAILAFTALGDYRDCENKIAECRLAILEKNYNDAITWMRDGNYENAISILAGIKDYKDSTELYKDAFIKLYGETLYSMQGIWHTCGNYAGYDSLCGFIKIEATTVYWKYHSNDSYKSDNTYRCTLAIDTLEAKGFWGSCVRKTWKLENGTIICTSYYNDGTASKDVYIRAESEISDACS